MALKTHKQLIACAKRELSLRQSLYPGMVNRGKMGADQCRHEIQCMGQILDLLESFPDPNQPELFEAETPANG